MYRTVKLGDRVRYRDNPTYIGTIVDITLEAEAFTVKWDGGSAGSNEDCNDHLDQYYGSQLIFEG